MTASQSKSQAHAEARENVCTAADASAVESEVSAVVQSVLGGRIDVYASLVKRFQASIMTVAMMLTRNLRAAEELTQDVFVRAYLSLSSFDQSRPMKPWLLKITYRLAQEASQHRITVARRQHQAQLEPQKVTSSPDPLEKLITDEQCRLLWKTVEMLPLAERTAVVLYYREGLSVAQAAQTMAVSCGTIKTLLFRARHDLKTALSRRGIAGQSRGAI